MHCSEGEFLFLLSTDRGRGFSGQSPIRSLHSTRNGLYVNRANVVALGLRRHQFLNEELFRNRFSGAGAAFVRARLQRRHRSVRLRTVRDRLFRLYRVTHAALALRRPSHCDVCCFGARQSLSRAGRCDVHDESPSCRGQNLLSFENSSHYGLLASSSNDLPEVDQCLKRQYRYECGDAESSSPS